MRLHSELGLERILRTDATQPIAPERPTLVGGMAPEASGKWRFKNLSDLPTVEQRWMGQAIPRDPGREGRPGDLPLNARHQAMTSANFEGITHPQNIVYQNNTE